MLIIKGSPKSKGMALIDPDVSPSLRNKKDYKEPRCNYAFK